MSRRSTVFFPLAAVVCLAALESQAGATDLTGHWLQEGLGTGNEVQFDITQTGDVVAIPMPVLFPGAVDGTIEATLVGTTLTGEETGNWSFRGRLVGGEDVIDGAIQLVYPNFPSARLLATRCECFDGNTTGGDGCDANCRVEPCFGCTGDPSACVPLGDGTACNDHEDCTSGETCSAGVCGGGAAVPSCTDMTGRWKVETSGGSAAYLLEDLRDVEQRDGFLRFRRPTYPELVAEVGTVDQPTGALELSGGLLPGAVPYFYVTLNEAIRSCHVSFTGAVSANQQSFSGGGTGDVGTVQLVGTSGVFYGGCSDEGVPFSQTAHRCAVGECLVPPEECPPCHTRDEAGSCVPGPRPGCVQSLSPRRSSMRVSAESSGPQRFSWKWTDGAAVPARLLGDLSDGSGFQLCIFDGNSNVLFEAYWTKTDWLGDHSWETKDGISFTRPGLLRGRERVKVAPGADGDSEIRISAFDSSFTAGIDPSYPYQGQPADGLPLSPFDLPLRMQAQIDRDGACFESTFDLDGVKRNADGAFKAKGTE